MKQIPDKLHPEEQNRVNRGPTIVRTIQVLRQLLDEAQIKRSVQPNQYVILRNHRRQIRRREEAILIVFLPLHDLTSG